MEPCSDFTPKSPAVITRAIYNTVSPQGAMAFPDIPSAAISGFTSTVCYNPLDCPDNSETFFTNCALNFGIFSTLYPAGAA